MTVSYDASLLTEGVEVSLFLGRKILPYINVKALNRNTITIDQILLRISKIYMETDINKNDNNDKNDKKSVYTPDQIEKFKSFQDWILKNAPRVAEMRNPFTISEYYGIVNDFKDKQQVKSLLMAMHNSIPLLKKNISANLTFRNWIKREGVNNHDKPVATVYVRPKLGVH